jgi:hypothetical protein
MGFDPRPEPGPTSGPNRCQPGPTGKLDSLLNG